LVWTNERQKEREIEMINRRTVVGDACRPINVQRLGNTTLLQQQHCNLHFVCCVVL
jgi:hypothetical protein